MNLRNYLGHLLYKSMGTTDFIRRIEWRSMLEWLDPSEGEKILDVACGDGTLSLKIAEKGCDVYGIDLSEKGINYAKRLAEREKITAKFEVGDAQRLPYRDSYFDKLICSSSLEHFPEDIQALKEMNRVLKPNGSLILTTDSFLYLNDGKIGQRHREVGRVVNYYSRETLKERLGISGFGMVRGEYLLKSPVTSFLSKIGIKMMWRGRLWMIISLLAYPLCFLFERLFSGRELGYTLIAEARKN